MKWKNRIPLFVIICLMACAYFSGVTEYLTFENLREHRVVLLQFIARHPVGAPLLFMLIYTIAVALSVPGAVILTLLGGFLFGVPIGTLYVVVSATIGAFAVYVAARTALGEILKKKAGPFLQKMESGFRKNAAGYLLFLRFIPAFPFWLVNLAPAFFRVKSSTYLWTTFIGIMPGSYVFTQAGTGLGAIFDTDADFSIGAIFNLQIRIALIVLAIFVLIPVFVKPLINKQRKNAR
ncbi:MAG: TVP38/TMEM64 family protein [Simkaniaceae bacterium]|nr:TVP38/TMEM64 family protein [Simkaniaceae bacterium]